MFIFPRTRGQYNYANDLSILKAVFNVYLMSYVGTSDKFLIKQFTDKLCVM